MKNPFASLFKKKTPESPKPEVPEAKESSSTVEAMPKSEAAIEKPAPGPKAKTEEKAPVASELVKEEPKNLPIPVLVPLYGKKETPEPEKAESATPYQHLPFEDDLQAAITTLVVDLADVYPQTFEEWEDGFRRDDNPEQEIAAWVHLAASLKATSEQFSLTLPEEKECFNILIACFTGSRETVKTRSQSELLNGEQVDQAIAYFYEGGY